MNSAMNRLSGLSYRSTGLAICASPLLEKTAIRSDIVSASRWSCVTEIVVMPQPVMQLPDFDLHGLAQVLVQRGQRLVHQQDSRLKTIARASAMRWRWPPGKFAPSARRIRQAAPSPRPCEPDPRFRIARLSEVFLSGYAMFSPTVMWGNRA